MTRLQKEKKIKKLVKEMIVESHKAALKKIDKAINCGALDIDSWDEKDAPMVVPKTITVALLESEASQYYGHGTAYKKKIKKEVSNIRYFI